MVRLGDRIDAEDAAIPVGPRCASVSGFSVHANVWVQARDRQRLERLCRYAARPPVATERLSALPDGRLIYALKRRYRDGTTHVLFEALELVEKLAALVPPPRSNLVRYHGVLAPASRWRTQLVPEGPDLESASSTGCTGEIPGRGIPRPEVDRPLPQRRSPRRVRIGVAIAAARVRTATGEPGARKSLKTLRHWSRIWASEGSG